MWCAHEKLTKNRISQLRFFPSPICLFLFLFDTIFMYNFSAKTQAISKRAFDSVDSANKRVVLWRWKKNGKHKTVAGFHGQWTRSFFDLPISEHSAVVCCWLKKKLLINRALWCCAWKYVSYLGRNVGNVDKTFKSIFFNTFNYILYDYKIYSKYNNYQINTVTIMNNISIYIIYFDLSLYNNTTIDDYRIFIKT